MAVILNKRQLGKTPIWVSELGFGGASIGNLYHNCTQQQAQETLTAAWDLGIRYFDTAPEYGHGLSERRIGDALRDLPRDQYRLSTKVGDLLRAHSQILPPRNKFINKLPFHLQFDYTYDGIMRAFEDSLQRLGLNQIDILLVHDLDPIVHQEEKFLAYFKSYINGGYKALDQLRKERVVQAIGLGVKQWEVCAKVMEEGDYDCFMLQGNYTLLEQPAFENFMPLCLAKKIALLLAGPYASGILATGPVEGAYYHHSHANEEILQRVRLIQRICDTHTTPMQAVALQFPLKHPAITSVVVGAATRDEIRNNSHYLQYNIPNALWAELKSEKIIPESAPV